MRYPTVDTTERDGLTARIEPDFDPMNPRTNFDHLWTFSASNREYDAHDKNAPSYSHGLREEGALVVPLWIGYGGRLSAGSLTEPLYNSDDTYRDYDDTSERIGDGFAYVERADMLKEYGHKIVTAKDKARALEVLKSEIEQYNQWAEGDVYGVVIADDDNDHIDSCWGFYGLDYARENAEEMLTSELEARGEWENNALYALDVFDNAPLIAYA
jgi:hypothetical protein